MATRSAAAATSARSSQFGGLHGVGVQYSLRCPAPDQTRHLGQGLDDARLVVDQLNGHQGHVTIEQQA